MENLLASLVALLDSVLAVLLVPLAAWVVLNGLDDVVIDVLGMRAAARRRAKFDPHLRQSVEDATQKTMAVAVPCWHEHGVIGRMIQQNIESIAYCHYDFFVGVYPNDTATVAEVHDLQKRYANVHLAMSPHDGPTSKADCLNSVWREILQFEQQRGVRFEVVVVHDAEDVVHPKELHWINRYADSYGMIQVPVLPLATPFRHWTHGIYCDEFSEYQSRDMPGRDAMGAFIPSCGVGTGFRRDAVDAVAEEEGHLFEPGCLTEDYENGLRLRLRGVPQIFLPLHDDGVATREFFPLTFGLAIRQRTRWVTGIVLQTWERHGWRGTLVNKYWLWRDRKGLLNSPAGVLANLLCIGGTVTWAASMVLGSDWGLARLISDHRLLLICSAMISVHRVVFRMICVARVYGWGFATGVPLRFLYANLINSVAGARAIKQYASARLRRRPLAWVKTAHSYPAQITFGQNGIRLGELLIAQGRITGRQLQEALATKPVDRRIGEHLIDSGVLAEHEVYQALSAQHGLPQTRLEASEIPRVVARALPAKVAREFRVLPFRIEFATMLLAAPEAPNDEVRKRLSRYTTLSLRFHLVTATNFEQLIAELL